MNFSIRGTPSHIIVAGPDNEQRARFNTHGFFGSLLRLPQRRCLDLLRLAAGIYIVDRIVKRPARREEDDHVRRLQVEFEVKEEAFWNEPETLGLLHRILAFQTQDEWTLSFVGARRPSELASQQYFPLEPPFELQRAALYSGGLDSAAGLAGRTFDGKNNFLLITVGHHTHLHRRVEEQLATLKTSMGASLFQSTLSVSLERGKARRTRFQERSQRSRSLLFFAAGAVAADAYGLRELEVFENGVGAINLPLMSGMLGSSLATRSAHPTFVHLMSRLLSRMIDEPFRFTLPYRTQTKAEMLRRLAGISDISGWLQQSRSCVLPTIRVPGKTHCGVCPGCLERRQAFSASGIEEDISRYVVDAVASPPRGDYLDLYRLDSADCLEQASRFQRRLHDHLRITGMDTAGDASIAALMERNAREALHVFGTLEHERGCTP